MRGYLFDSDTNEVYLNSNRYASHSNHCVIIKSKQNLIERYSLMGLVSVAERLQVLVQDDWTSAELTDAVWNKMKELTDEQIRDERRAKRTASRKVSVENRGPGNYSAKPRRVRWPRTYRVCRETIGKELYPGGRLAIAQQAISILEGIRQQPVDVFTEQEMKDFVNGLAKAGLLTGRNGSELKADPWQVWTYYEPMFNSCGFITRHLEKQSG